jgi:hypothetical protein
MELTGRGLELDNVEATGIAKICDAVKRLGLSGKPVEGTPPTDQQRIDAEWISDLLVTTYIQTDGEAYINPTRCAQFKSIANIAMNNPSAVVMDICTGAGNWPFDPGMRLEAFGALAVTSQAHDIIRAHAPIAV